MNGNADGDGYWGVILRDGRLSGENMLGKMPKREKHADVENLVQYCAQLVSSKLFHFASQSGQGSSAVA